MIFQKALELYTCAMYIYIYTHVCIHMYVCLCTSILRVQDTFGQSLCSCETPQSRSPPLLALTAAASCAAQSLKLLKEVQSGRMEGIDVRSTWKLVGENFVRLDWWIDCPSLNFCLGTLVCHDLIQRECKKLRIRSRSRKFSMWNIGVNDSGGPEAEDFGGFGGTQRRHHGSWTQQAELCLVSCGRVTMDHNSFYHFATMHFKNDIAWSSPLSISACWHFPQRYHLKFPMFKSTSFNPVWHSWPLPFEEDLLWFWEVASMLKASLPKLGERPQPKVEKNEVRVLWFFRRRDGNVKTSWNHP